MRSKIIAVAAIAVTGLALPSVHSAEPDLAKTRSALEKWVEFRKLISEEEHTWRAEKESIISSVDLIKSEIERLDSEMAQLDEGVTQADRERAQLNDENTELKQASLSVSGVIVALEARIVEIHDMFPPDLKNKVQPLFLRIPKRGATTRAGTGERLQNVVGILSEVEKFHRAITLTKEMQKLPGGETAQVKTIYLGLGVGYFVNEAGTYGGILTPAKGEWTATIRADIAPAIRRAIGVYENDVLAEFVGLPVEIK